MRELYKTLTNVFTFAMSKRSTRILWNKFRLRLTELGKSEASEARKWAALKSENTSTFMSKLDANLQIETHFFVQKVVSESVPTVQQLAFKGIDLGGGGSIDLIYFLCRFLKPNYVLETGVAAGWSSYAILEALSENKKGFLDSSDLPYFRIENPEQYIGILVPERLRNLKNWDLQKKGDSDNLKEFLTGNKKYSIVHYDSDKRKMSRLGFLKKIEPWLSNEAILIMDDIQDNLAFKEYVLSRTLTYKVFEYEEKYIGIIFQGGLLTPQ